MYILRLREIVNGLPAVSATGAKVPRISTKESLKGEDNMEKIWNTALAAFWTISGGDWEAYDKIVNEKLSDSVSL